MNSPVLTQQRESKLATIEISMFNEQGNKRFEELLLMRPKNLLTLVEELVVASEYINKLNVELELAPLKSRLDLAKHLWKYLNPSTALFEYVGSTFFWNWMAAAWMSTLVNADDRPELQDKLGRQIERWLLTSNTLRYHRHLVSGPFFAYQSNYPNIDEAMCLLATDVLAPGEVVERIAGKRSLSTGVVCHVATLLYFDSTEHCLRKGVTSPPGNPKAFSRYFTQIDLTIDYEGMSATELLGILPNNFEKWVKFAQIDLNTKSRKS